MGLQRVSNPYYLGMLGFILTIYCKHTALTMQTFPNLFVYLFLTDTFDQKQNSRQTCSVQTTDQVF